MLVSDGLLISIEAKFGSGNALAQEGKAGAGEKPTARQDLLDRYLRPGKADGASRVEAIGERFHSQLFRNIVFAA